MKLMTCAKCAQSVNAKRETCPFCGTPTATSADIADRLYRGRTLEMRVGASDALGDIATPGAVRLLTSALTNKYRYSPDLSHCVAHELARIGEPAVPAIEALLRDRVAGPYAREALDMIRPEIANGTPSRSGVEGAATAAVPDRVGQSLVRMKSSAELRLGLIAGGSVVGITWLVTFLLGLIPVHALGVALLSPAS